MIRVNLLRNRKGALTDPSGPSAFSSRREVLLACSFLLVGGAILFYVLSGDHGSSSVSASRFDIVRQPSEARGSAPPPAGGAAESEIPPLQGTSGDAPQQAAGASTPSPLPAADVLAGAGTAQATAADTGPSAGTAQGKTPAAPPAPTASTVHSLRVSPEVGRVRILLAADGWPEYKLFRVDNPDRLVLDMPGVVHEVPGPERTRQLDHPLVHEIRIAQNQLEPPLVRLVFVVSGSPEVQVLPRPDALVIEISGGQP